MKSCNKCKYRWVSRRKNPKECPRCKTRLDWNSDNSKITNAKIRQQVIENEIQRYER